MDGPVGWNANEQKLLALIVLDDDVAEKLNLDAGEAFFRGFIIQDRYTGAVSMNFRFRYRHGDSWFAVKPKPDWGVEEAIKELSDGLVSVVRQAAMLMGVMVYADDLKCFRLPDDNGDWEATVAWLYERDLIHFPRKARAPSAGGGGASNTKEKA